MLLARQPNGRNDGRSKRWIGNRFPSSRLLRLLEVCINESRHARGPRFQRPRVHIYSLIVGTRIDGDGSGAANHHGVAVDEVHLGVDEGYVLETRK